MATTDTAGVKLGDPASDERKSRRRVLAMMGASGAAAAAATLASREQARAGHDATNNLHLGESNFAPTGEETEVNADVEGFGVRVNNNGASGEDAASGAIQGHSDAGVAGRFTTSTGASLQCDGLASVFGDVEDDLFRVGNDHVGGNGISGIASGHHAVEGVNVSSDPEDGSAGVVGVSAISESEGYGEGPGTGVAGGSGTGTGVAGFCSGSGTGVRGDSIDGIGVSAFSENGTALSVEGKAAFANAGSGTVPAGQSSAFVNAVVTENSHVTVTLTSDANGRAVSSVDRDPGNGFTVRLTKKGQAVDFTFLVVEPG